MTAMGKTARVMAALKGEAVDRAPISFWGHFYDREGSAHGLAESMVAFNRRYDWDVVKVQARASYHAEIWGGEYGPSPDGVATPRCTRSILNSPADWEKIDVKGPEVGVLAEQCEALRQINGALAHQVPVIQTVFAPLTIAYHLCGRDEKKLSEIIQRDKSGAREGLTNIARTLTPYMRRCLEAGASGFFFSLSVGLSRDYMREDEYSDLAMALDLDILREISPRASFVMLHVCGARIMFDLVREYPVHAFNWSTTEPGNPTVAEVLAKTDKAVVGGLPEKRSMVETTAERLGAQVRELLAVTGGRRLLLGGGCSQFLKLVPERHFDAVREAAHVGSPRPHDARGHEGH